MLFPHCKLIRSMLALGSVSPLESESESESELGLEWEWEWELVLVLE
jgi:hypothetical protein